MNSLMIKKVTDELSLQWTLQDIFPSSENMNGNYFFSKPFKFEDTDWRLLLASKASHDSEFSQLTFMSVDSCKLPVDYKFYLKIQDGSLIEIASGSIEINEQSSPAYVKLIYFLKLKEMLKPMPKFVTFVGSLKAKRKVSNEPKPKELKKMETLSQNFYNLYMNEQCCDVTLDIRGNKYKVHKAILMARSSVFAAIFQHDTLATQTGIISVEDCDPVSFPEFLKFLYCGQIDDITYSTAYNLYVTSEKFNVQELKLFCREHLMEALQFGTWSNIYVLAKSHNDMELEKAAENFFIDNLGQILKSSEFEDFMKNNPELGFKLLKAAPEKKVAKLVAKVLKS